MRSEGRIRHQFKQVLFRRRKLAIQEALEVKPSNCIHNRTESRVRANHPRSLPVLNFGVCTLGGDKDLPVCDGEIQDVSKSCPHFKSVQTVEDVKDFYKGLPRMSPQELVKLGFPDLAALAWVLMEPQDQEGELEDEAGEEVGSDPSTSLVQTQDKVVGDEGHKGIWERIKGWFRSWI